MFIEYEKDFLKELYEEGTCKNEKSRFDAAVIKKYQKRMDTLMAATRMEDLFVFHSLNFEALPGRSHCFSIRIDSHYRLEFKVRREGNGPVVTIYVLTDRTNPYQ